MLYLIDYESVDAQGIKEIGSLSETDEVKFFFSTNQLIPMDVMQDIRRCKAKIDFIEGNEDLLCSLVGYLFGSRYCSSITLVTMQEYPSMCSYWSNFKIYITQSLHSISKAPAEPIKVQKKVISHEIKQEPKEYDERFVDIDSYSEIRNIDVDAPMRETMRRPKNVQTKYKPKSRTVVAKKKKIQPDDFCDCEPQKPVFITVNEKLAKAGR